MSNNETFFDLIIIPDKAIYRGNIYELQVSTNFIMKGFKVITMNDKIFEVYIRGKHPNANPRTREFCLPPVTYKLPINKDSENLIYNKLMCYNLDDCYYIPWNEIELNQLEVR